MWQIPKVSTAAVQVLASSKPLTEAAVNMFLNLQTHPACILPLLKCLPAACFDAAGPQAAKVKHTLLSALGALEEVWANVALRDVLLDLT